MISLKKGFFALSLGIGMAVSLNAWAFPTCDTCMAWKDECAAGDANACYQYQRLSCASAYPGNSCPES